jgi:hypothetical protein
MSIKPGNFRPRRPLAWPLNLGGAAPAAVVRGAIELRAFRWSDEMTPETAEQAVIRDETKPEKTA